MPAISAPNLTLLRTTKHATQLALSVYHPPEIWRARTSGAQAEGAAAITVNAGTVVQTRAPYKHAQVLISAVGYGLDDLGVTHFKSFSSPTLNVGSHNSTLPNGAYITIVDWIMPTAIHPTLNASDVVSEDGNVAYTNENVNYMPLARMGCPAVAYIDAATGLATIKFYSSSVAIAPAATLSTYAWSFRGGTPSTSASAGTAGAPVTVTWNAAGEYYCFLTVTDSNGKTHTRRTPVFIYDAPGGATQPYTQLEIDNMNGDAERGWSAHIKVHGAATETEFPNQALCVLSARDWYGDTETSIGGQYTWRENIVLTGYVRTGTTKQNAQYGYVEFDLESSPIDNLEGLAGTLTTTTGTPAGWHELKNMTLNLAAHHILTQHTTLSEIADVHLDLLTYAKSVIDLPESSVQDQLGMAATIPARGRACFSAQGMLYLESDPQLLPPASRVGYTNPFGNSPAPNLASMAMADFRDEIDLGTERAEKQVGQIDLAAESAAAVAIYSLAPARSWRNGRGERVSSIRADSQNEANTLAGIIEGKRNNDFADVVLPLRGNYRIVDTAPAEQLQITLTAAQNKRGIVWANERCWPKRVSYEYQAGGILLASLVVEKDAIPSTGITGNYPTTPPDWPPPTFPPVEPPVEPPVIVPGDMPGKGNLFYVSSMKGAAKCTGAYGTNGTDGTPVWTAINTGLTGDALKIRWMVLDPFSVSGDHFEKMWAMTDDGVYYCTGLPNAASWASQLTYAQANTLAGNPAATFGTGMLTYHVAPNVRKAGFVACQVIYGTGSGKSWNGVALPGGNGLIAFVVYSLNYGTTWQCDSTKFTTYAGIVGLGPDVDRIYLDASYHLDNTYYMASGSRPQDRPPIGDQTNVSYAAPQITYMRAPGSRGTAFPDFSPGMADGYSSSTDSYGRMCMPYCDNAGAVYANDNRVYLYGLYASGSTPGVAAIKRYSSAFSPLWSAGYTPPTNVNVGDATMAQVNYLFTNMFNEDTAIAIDGSNIWLSSNLSQASPTWTRKTGGGLVVGGRAFSPRYQYCVPCDINIALFTGKTTGAGVAQVVLTPDFGTTLVDVTNHGGANDLDTVLSLSGTDMDTSIIQLDYFKA